MKKNNASVYLLALATEVPDNAPAQDEIRDFMLNTVADTELKKSFIKRVYQSSAINVRHSVLKDFQVSQEERMFFPKNKTLDPEPTTAQRNDIFCLESNKLALKVVEKLIQGLAVSVKEKITHLITVSCTGFAAPGFDYHICVNMGLNPQVHRFHLGFMGCYAAFPAMKLARDISLAHADALVLIVDIELCTLHFQKKFVPDMVVANALFADGAAACLIGQNKKLFKKNTVLSLREFNTELIPETASDMAWVIGEHGFDMKLSTYVPKVIEANIKKILQDILQKAKIKKNKELHWAIHPGGRAILDKVKESLALPENALEVSYKTLWENGNMSSVTMFFVIEKILKQFKEGLVFACAFGPGLTVESGLLEVVQI